MAAIRRLRTTAPFLARCIGLSQSRSYGGAAAVQLQYDYDYYEEEDYERDRARRLGSPLADAENSISGRGVQWVFIGSPGSKKHVYAQRLSKLLDVPHISMGSLVRQELNPRSSLYKQIANAVNQGKLVPEEIIFGLLSKRLEEGYVRGETGFILDGIPRTRIQAEILDEIADIDLVVNFKCTEDCLLKKHLGSGICSHCHEYFTIRNSGSASLDVSAQADSERMWKEKVQTYVEQSKPLEEYYRKQNKLLDFDVCGAPGGIWQGLLAALHLQDVNAIHSDHSSPKLTA